MKLLTLLRKFKKHEILYCRKTFSHFVSSISLHPNVLNSSKCANLWFQKFSSPQLLGHSSLIIYCCSTFLCVFVIFAIFMQIYVIEVLLVLCIHTQSENSDESSHAILGIKLKSSDIVFITYSSSFFLIRDLFFQNNFMFVIVSYLF